MSERTPSIRFTLPDLPLPGAAVTGTLPDSPEQLRALILQDRSQLLDSLQIDLSRQIEALIQQRVATEVARKVQQIIEQNRLARHRMFGPSSESGQGQLFNEAEALVGEATDDEPELVSAPLKRRPRARGHRRALPPELPRVEVVIDLPEEARRDATGSPMVRIGEEISEVLDIVPMKIRVIRTIRPRYAPADGGTAPVVASLVPSILPRSNFSAGFLAMLLVAKYADGLPLYRFGKVLSRHGVEVPRQTLARAVIATAHALQPLHNLMRDALLESPVIHMDETPVQVLKEPGKAATSRSYMWVQRGGPPGKPVVLFDYDPSRSGEVPKRLLRGWRGYLMTDDYAGYDAVASEAGVEHLACMAHARRRFVDARRASPKGRNSRAEQALVFFARLYRIERRVQRAPDALRYRVRQKLSRATLGELRTWLDEQLPQVVPRGKLGEALAYLNNIWSRLVRYIERGDLPIDNNACENAIRPFVVGRKGWLFADQPAGAHASAVIYSLIETAKACGREPYAWLLYALERLPLARTVDAVEALLPWNVHDQDLAMTLSTRE